ncbi:MAG: efflux RND transporter periplasmic adaptor subunit, partial [Duncaniella sp.]|nr:efflux RND transporter periplasmic adaptor subunit [Duncaniella sp.]
MKYPLPLLVGALILAGCSGEQTSRSSLHSVYVTTPVSADTSGETRLLSGVVEEAHGISLGFKTPGQITKLYVKEGDYVHAGQLLAQLD